MSGWLSRIDIAPSEYLHSDQLNSLGLDIRNWGGDVNGGGFRLSNVLLTGAVSAAFNPSPFNVTQTNAVAPSTSYTQYSTAYTGEPPAPQPVARWTAGKNGDSESGSNAGSNYAITRYTDAGAVFSTNPVPFLINRQTGIISMGQQLWTGPVNGNGQTLTNVTIPGVLADPTNAKGDVIVRSASALARLGVGSDGQVLMADSTQTTGVKWAANPGAVASVFGRTGVITAQAHDYNVSQVDNAVSSVVAYADPTWITSLAWSKISGAPAFVPTTRQVFAGNGMSGGGPLSTDITLTANVLSVFGRIGAIVLTAADITGAGGVSASRQVLAGSGMTGGGPLTGDVTLNANIQTVFGRTGAIVLTTTDISGAGGVTQSRKVATDGTTLQGGGDLSVDRTLSAVPDSIVQRVRASQNGALMTTSTGGRREINFIQGSNVTLTVSDNAINNRVDVAIAAAGPGTSLPIDPTTTLGDLIVSSGLGGTSNLKRLPVGGDTQVLMADATQPLGVKWGVAPGIPQTPWVSNIDAAGFSLTNAGTITASGVIRSSSGGIGFPDGTTQMTAGVLPSVQVKAGAGMTGGGPLTGDVTLTAQVLSVFGRVGAVTLTQADITSAGGVGNTTRVIAGAGMSGGGPLSGDVTVNANVLTVFGRTGNVTLTAGDITGVGGAIVAGTTGQVQFNASGALAASANFFWDNTNVGLYIGGTTVPISAILAGATVLTVKGSTSVGIVEVGTAIADTLNGLVGQYTFNDANNTQSNKRIAVVQALTTGPTVGNRGGSLTLNTRSDASPNPVERMRIDHNGSVGVNSTTMTGILNSNSASFNPTANLAAAFVAQNAYGGGLVFASASISSGIWMTSGPATMNFRADGTASSFPGAYGQVMLMASGSMLIGLPNPITTSLNLVVNNNMYIRRPGAGNGWRFNVDLNGLLRMDYMQDDGTTIVSPRSPNICCTFDGLVGIGNTSPTHQLTVYGGSLGTTAGASLNIAKLYCLSSNADMLSTYVYRWAAGSSWDSTEWRIQRTVDATNMGWIGFQAQDITFGVNSAERMRLGSNGNIGVNTGAAPSYIFTTRGPGGPHDASGTVATTGSLRVEVTTGGNVLDFGGYNGSPFYMWIQTSDRNNMAGNYPLAIMPYGGNTGIATSSIGGALTVGTRGTGSINFRGDPSTFGFPSAMGAIIQSVTTDQTAHVSMGFYATAFNFLGGSVGINKGSSGPNAAYLLDVGGDINITGSYRVNGVAFSGGGITTQSNQTGNRSVLGVYQNNTGKPMYVIASVAPSVSALFTGVTGTTNPPQTIVAEQGAGIVNSAVSVGFWVMPGYFYQVVISSGTGSVHQWLEWY